MEQREILLRRAGLKCADFARQLSYHRALNDHKDGFKLNFWIYVFNNSIDLAVLDWFHLFGYHNDDLHWKQIVADVDSFRQKLFNHVHMTEDQWNSYREEIKTYRDKDVAHIEVRPKSQVPEMSIALKAATYYYEYVLEELKGFADYRNWPQNLDEYHQKSFKQTKEIVKIAYSASRQFKERVF